MLYLLLCMLRLNGTARNVLVFSGGKTPILLSTRATLSGLHGYFSVTRVPKVSSAGYSELIQ